MMCRGKRPLLAFQIDEQGGRTFSLLSHTLLFHASFLSIVNFSLNVSSFFDATREYALGQTVSLSDPLAPIS